MQYTKIYDVIDINKLQLDTYDVKLEINNNIADVLTSYIKIFHRYKSKNKLFLNTSMDIIKSNIEKSKIKEKDKIVIGISKLSMDEKDVENIMKQQSLGRWSLGKSKAIFKYDKLQYEREILEMETDYKEELESKKVDDVSEMINYVYGFDISDDMENTSNLTNEDVTNSIHNEIISGMAEIADDDDYGENMDGDERF